MEGMPWSLSDDELLVAEYVKCAAIKEIARVVERSPDAVASRLRYLRAQGVNIPSRTSKDVRAYRARHLNGLLERIGNDQE